MRPTWLALGLIALSAVPGVCAEGPGELRWSGYLKNFFVAEDPAAVSGSLLSASPAWVALDLQSFRLRADWRPTPGFSLLAAYELTAQVGTALPNVIWYSLRQAMDYRVADLSHTIVDQSQSEFMLSQNLDRLVATFSWAHADLSVGRQPIAFGSARVVSPTDVLVPFSVLALDREERPGVDAVRVRVPWGAMGETDAGWVLGPQALPSESAGFIKQRFEVLKTDLSLVAMVFRENALLGLDLARSVGGVGVWLEGAYTWTQALAHPSDPSNYLRLSLGADTQLADGLYGFVECHYNGPGAAAPADYLSQPATPAYVAAPIFLVGRQYLIPGINYQVSPLLTASGQVLWNLMDTSVLAVVSLGYSLAEGIDLTGGGYFGWGPGATSPDGTTTVARSEFGLYPTVLYAALRLYF